MTHQLTVITNCDGCSGCCRGRIVPPFDDADDPEFLALPDVLRESLRPRLTSNTRDVPDDAACCWLDLATHRCRNYEHRPVACRDFERGSYYCLLFRNRWSVISTNTVRAEDSTGASGVPVRTE